MTKQRAGRLLLQEVRSKFIWVSKVIMQLYEICTAIREGRLNQADETVRALLIEIYAPNVDFSTDQSICSNLIKLSQFLFSNRRDVFRNPGGILDTVLHGISGMLGKFPSILNEASDFCLSVSQGSSIECEHLVEILASILLGWIVR